MAWAAIRTEEEALIGSDKITSEPQYNQLDK
jgi:hypothetical protein